ERSAYASPLGIVAPSENSPAVAGLFFITGKLLCGNGKLRQGFDKIHGLVSPLNDPMRTGRLDSGCLHRRMCRQYALQNGFLAAVDIDKQHMAAGLQRVLKAREMVIRFLNAPQSAFPCAKAEQHDGDEYER